MMTKVLSSLKRIVHQWETVFYYHFPIGKKNNFTYEEAIEFLHSVRPDKSGDVSIKFVDMACDLSIIIPVYNAEKYLSACLNSVIRQCTRFNYEMIVVDDGSTDRSLTILKQHQDQKLKVHSVPNRGPGSARNFGLSQAQGRYIMFVDADDQLLPDAVERLMDEALKNDACIVQGNIIYFYEKDQSSRLAYAESADKVIDIQINKEAIFNLQGYPVAKVFKRELFTDAGFPHYAFEDTLIWLITYRRAKKIMALHDAVYSYTIHKDSESGRVSAGSSKGIDTFYIVPYLIELNDRLGLSFDGVFYRQVLCQFGKIMYDRNRKLGEKVLQSLIVAARLTLEKYEEYCPAQLSWKEKYLKKSILQSDVELYQRTVLYL